MADKVRTLSANVQIARPFYRNTTLLSEHKHLNYAMIRAAFMGLKDG